ncbi:hypothetical protein I7I50_00332 [Histoplasma capsulatum G186AR]|nr:hypothetical protein I7I50_00332 [Histoplasma capsulatum G186AR]
MFATLSCILRPVQDEIECHDTSSLEQVPACTQSPNLPFSGFHGRLQKKKKKYRARTGKGAKKGVRRTMTDVWMCCLQWSCFCLSMPLRDKLFIVEPMIISSLEADINLMAW